MSMIHKEQVTLGMLDGGINTAINKRSPEGSSFQARATIDTTRILAARILHDDLVERDIPVGVSFLTRNAPQVRLRIGQEALTSEKSILSQLPLNSRRLQLLRSFFLRKDPSLYDEMEAEKTRGTDEPIPFVDQEMFPRYVAGLLSIQGGMSCRNGTLSEKHGFEPVINLTTPHSGLATSLKTRWPGSVVSERKPKKNRIKAQTTHEWEVRGESALGVFDDIHSHMPVEPQVAIVQSYRRLLTARIAGMTKIRASMSTNKSEGYHDADPKVMSEVHEQLADEFTTLKRREAIFSLTEKEEFCDWSGRNIGSL